MNNHVAIIGTGFGGIATAVGLQQARFDHFVPIHARPSAPASALGSPGQLTFV
jgi:cation diffusion facilitator CzcD-associated flavoprotein CzcO